MITFHPTLSLQNFIKALTYDPEKNGLATTIQELSPNNNLYLTDSGTSCLALAIDSLGLRSGTLALPAFLCSILLPVLEEYKVNPVFLDIDPQTFQPPLKAYTSETLRQVDAVLMVRTYGQPIPESIISYLREHGKTIIEDRAHCPLPSKGEEILSDACYWSLPKTMPVPGGGLLALNQSRLVDWPTADTAEKPSLISVLKIWSLFASAVSVVKIIFGLERSSRLSWKKARSISKLSKKFLAYGLSQTDNKNYRAYCIPSMPDNRKQVRRKLLFRGIISEPIWHDPIIKNKEAQLRYGLSLTEFPNTVTVSQHILCIPAWDNHALESTS